MTTPCDHAIGSMVRDVWGPAQEILDTIADRIDLKRRVILPPDLSKLTHPEKDALILALAAELAAAQERIGDARRTHRGAGGAARRLSRLGEDAGQD